MKTEEKYFLNLLFRTLIEYLVNLLGFKCNLTKRSAIEILKSKMSFFVPPLISNRSSY